MKKIFFGIILLLFLVSTAVYMRDPIFWQHYTGAIKSFALKQPRGVWYSPLEQVKGGEGTLLARNPDQPNLSIEALETAEAYAEKHNSYSFMVWHDGAVISERYFQDHNANSLIVSKSMAKPLSSMVVARAFEQGYIESLDQSASDFITEWMGTEKEAISIRHLLNMSSGIERFYQQTLNPFSLFHQAFLSGKHEEVILNAPLVEPPGSYYDYSQLTSDLIAILVERATGQQYQDYLSSELLQPIGAAGGDIWVNREGGVAHSGCCIMLPSETWLKLGVLLVQNGVWGDERLLPDWWNNEILKGSATNSNYGLYFWLGSPHQERRYFIDPEYQPTPGTLQSEPYAAEDLFMFDGNGNQVVYIVPSKKLVILRTGGWPGEDENGQEWDNSFLPNSLISALKADSTEQAQIAPSAPQSPPSFSAAMQVYKPLGKVAGDFRPMFSAPVADGNQFQDAVKYAKDMSSYALLVWQDGQILVEKYFKGFDQNLRPDTASMHKSVLGLVVAAAIEDGFINNVNDPIGKYLPQWQDTPEGNISILNLLNMSSGLKRLSDEGGMNSPRIQFFTAGENARSTLYSMKLGVEPGSRFIYANTNSQILGLVLESATGKPYAEYLSERIWQRIGAEDAYVWNYEPTGFPRTYSALLARAKDWLRVGLLIKDRGLLNDDQIISSELIDQITASSEVNPNYGWQTWLGRQYETQRFYNDDKTGPSFASAEPFDTSDMIYFDGIGGQRVYISREKNLVVIRVGDLRFDWDDTHLPNLVMRALK